tara:strand:- start:949 stop:1749 length:801 start_codon:yes stop_codon:yes gene_type:complete
MQRLQLEKSKNPVKELEKTATSRAQIPDDVVRLNEEAVLKYEGKIVGAYFKLGMNDKYQGELLQSLKDTKFLFAKRSSGIKNTSKVFGFQPRMPIKQQNYCTLAAYNNENPTGLRYMKQLMQAISVAYEKLLPGMAREHKRTLENEVLPEWKLNPYFTSGIINKNNQLVYHYDRGNFSEPSAMYISAKEVEGGELYIPEFNLLIEPKNDYVLIFDGKKWLHGVMPFQLFQTSHRYTIVFYSLRDMKSCLTFEEEKNRAKELYASKI